MKRWAHRIRQQSNMGPNIAHAGRGNINLISNLGLGFLPEAYKADALALLPGQFLDREAEQAELIDLAMSDGYAWYQGSPWTGKSALMAWLVANTPPSIRMACFFVNSRIPGEADSNAFTRAMVRQLARIANIEIGSEIPGEARSGQLAHILSCAAKVVNNSDQRLVIVVDGLDEDQGHSPSIAYTLPRRLPAGVRIIVSSRPYPLLPSDVPGDHPLRACRPRTLEPSPHAIKIRDNAAYEIARHLNISKYREIVGLLVAAGGGGLSSADLAELTGAQSSASITDLMHTELGRIIDVLPRNSQIAQPAWMLAHDMLLRTAKDRLDEELPRYLGQINQWADCYRQEHWHASTPDYLLHSYTHMLLGVGDLGRAVELAIDHQRHELIFRRTNTDAVTLNEIASVQLSLRQGDDQDLKALAKLAFHKFSIRARSAALPDDLPLVWAELGDLDRAEALARTIAWPEERALTLVDVAYKIASVDTERACALCASAEAVIPHIDRTGGRVGVLSGIVGVLASFDPDRAEQFTNSLDDPRTMALGLAEVAEALIDSDPERAAKLCERAIELAPPFVNEYYSLDALTEPAQILAGIDFSRAKALADKINEPQIQAAVLIAIANAVASKDVERAKLLCTTVLQLVEASSESSWRENDRQDNLANVAVIVAAIDLDKAKVIAMSITDPRKRVKALTNVAVAAIPNIPRQAEELALSLAQDDSSSSPLAKFAKALAASDVDGSQELAYTINDISERASILIRVMEIVGRTSPERALKICDTVEELVYSVDDPVKRPALLTNMAAGIRSVSSERAFKLCEAAERAARLLPNFVSLGCVASKIAAALGCVDPGRAVRFCAVSEFIAENLVDSSSGRDFVLAEVALALAAIEPDHAMNVLDSIRDGELYADALCKMVGDVARADPSRIGGLLEMIKGFEYYGPSSYQEMGGMLEQLARADLEAARLFAASISGSDPLGRIITSALITRAIQEAEPQAASRLRDEAIQIVPTVSETYERAVALAWVAFAFSSLDQRRASELLDEAEREADSVLKSRHHEMALARMVYPIAMTAPNRAERICESLVEKDWHAYALADFCRAASEGRAVHLASARAALATLLVETEYDLLGGDWTSSLNSLASIDPPAISAIADQFDSEVARYPELATHGSESQ
jgi:hypothetical protein